MKDMLFLFGFASGIFGWLAGDRSHHWEEDVQLSDGAIIKVKRTDDLEIAGGSLFRTERWLQGARMMLPSKDGKPIEWQGNLLPMIVERGTDPVEWIVIGSTISCTQFRQYDRPKPAYVQFDYANGKWTYHVVDPAFYSHVSNLLTNGERSYQGGPITLDDKRIWNTVDKKMAHRYLSVDPRINSACREGDK